MNCIKVKIINPNKGNLSCILVDSVGAALQGFKKKSCWLSNVKAKKQMEMYICGIINMDELTQKTKVLDKQIENIKQKLTSLSRQNRLDNQEKYSLKASGINHIICEENLTHDLLKKIIDKITVNKKGEIKIFIKAIDV